MGSDESHWVSNEPVLDYCVGCVWGGWFKSARWPYQGGKSICEKKRAQQLPLSGAAGGISTSQQAMVGVIIQTAQSAAKSANQRQGVIEIIDPNFGRSNVVDRSGGIHAGMYRHYAGVAMFAGLYDIAEELLERANALAKGRSRKSLGQYIRFNNRDVLQVGHRNLVGIQWRPSDQANLDDDVWFYQVLDRDVIRELVVNDVFPHTRSYAFDKTVPGNREFVESLFPVGS